MATTIECEARRRRPPLFLDPPPERRPDAWTTLYVRRLVAVPPGRACMRLAMLLAGPGAVLEAGRVRLVAGPVRPNGGALARASCILRGPWGWSVPVDLEVVRWSDRRTELAVRPTCGSYRLHDPERYFAAAHAVLDELTARVG